MGSFDEFVDHITNGTVFLASCKEYASSVSPSLIITSITMLFLIFAAVDYLLGNKFGYGKKYEEAWETLPSLALGMIGITALTPVLRIIFKPLISPIYAGLGADPAMFAGTLLACDMGGYPFAIKMAGEGNLAVGLYAGLILGSMLGATIVFIIPLGMKMIPKELHIYFAYGTLIGLLSIPFGMLTGGASMALTPHGLPIIEVLKNISPVLLFTVVIGLCLFIFPNGTLVAFLWFGKIISFLMVFGTVLAIFQYKAIIKFPLFDTMVDPSANEGENALLSGILAIGEIACMLAGTLPMVHFIITTFGGCLAKLGRYAGLTDIDSGLLISSLANVIPTFDRFADMSERGRIINSAFAVGAAFVFGDHLGYVGAVQSDMILPMIIGKLTSGIVAVIISTFTAKFFINKISQMAPKEEEQGLSSEVQPETNLEPDGNLGPEISSELSTESDHLREYD